MSISRKEQSVIHNITEYIRSISKAPEVEPEELTRLILAAKTYFKVNSRDKAESFSTQFAEAEDIPVSKVDQLIELTAHYMTNSELSRNTRLNPESHAAIIAASGTILTGGVNLLEHPDVVDLRNRVLKSYSPRKEAKIALFVPCSKIKPYRHSRTHKAIDKTIERATGNDPTKMKVIDMLVISEPIGVVPRSWDMYYPAMNYEMTLPTWIPLDKLNEHRLVGEDRTKTFQRISKLSKGGSSKSKTNLIIETLSNVIAEFLDKQARKYDKIIGYVRSSHRLMLELASQKGDIDIEFIPSSAQVSEIITDRGKLHWTFQGLRGKPANGILEKKISSLVRSL